MDYKKFGNSVYVRFDKGDEVVSGILNICKKEKILSATYSGIGCCSEIVVSSYLPEKSTFKEQIKKGILDIASLNGNISSDENNEICSHTHAVFSFLSDTNNIELTGGHLIKAVILYTAEIVINPVMNGTIRQMKDPITGVTVWKL